MCLSHTLRSPSVRIPQIEITISKYHKNPSGLSMSENIFCQLIAWCRFDWFRSMGRRILRCNKETCIQQSPIFEPQPYFHCLILIVRLHITHDLFLLFSFESLGVAMQRKQTTIDRLRREQNSKLREEQTVLSEKVADLERELARIAKEREDMAEEVRSGPHDTFVAAGKRSCRVCTRLSNYLPFEVFRVRSMVTHEQS